MITTSEEIMRLQIVRPEGRKQFFVQAPDDQVHKFPATEGDKDGMVRTFSWDAQTRKLKLIKP